MKQKYENELSLSIDYDLFTTEEIVKIFNFYSFMERCHHHHIKEDEIISRYNEYRSIINNQSLQKKYDKNFEKSTGISIYKIITGIGYKY